MLNEMEYTVFDTANADVLNEESTVVICACNYEGRAINVVSERERRGHVDTIFVLNSSRYSNFSYGENHSFFESRKATIIDEDAENSITELISFITTNLTENSAKSIVIDITCMKRRLIAAVVAELVRHQFMRLGEGIKYIFAYSPSVFVPPSEDFLANHTVGPVNPFFAGWSLDPELPPATIVGLGYEKGKALGAVEYLQALPNVWAFIPTSNIDEFESLVREHNSHLLDAITGNKVIQYRLSNPDSLLSDLEILTSGIEHRFNPVFLPFGPKLFFVLSLLISIRHRSSSVWHVSSEDEYPAINRPATKEIVGLKFRLGKHHRTI